jgi:hypothetical protein
VSSAKEDGESIFSLPQSSNWSAEGEELDDEDALAKLFLSQCFRVREECLDNPMVAIAGFLTSRKMEQFVCA